MERQVEGKTAEIHFLKVIPVLAKGDLLFNNCLCFFKSRSEGLQPGLRRPNQEEDKNSPRAEDYPWRRPTM